MLDSADVQILNDAELHNYIPSAEGFCEEIAFLHQTAEGLPPKGIRKPLLFA